MNVFKVESDAKGIFIERLNRFVGLVNIISPQELSEVKVHIHDSGRLGELLFKGNEVLLKKASERAKRKTEWDLIASKFKDQWVLTNSGLHRKIAESLFRKGIPFGPLEEIRPEVRINSSRLDFLLLNKKGEKIWVEVKGCTLTERGVALFPDAPTSRGKRHVEELIAIAKNRERASIVFLVMRKDSRCFYPNVKTDPEFAEVFFKALEAKVEVYPILLEFTPPLLSFRKILPICSHDEGSFLNR